MLNINNNLLSISRLTANTSFRSTPCNGPLSIGGSALLGALPAVGGLFSGLIGAHSQDQTNKMNYRIWREQQAFSAQEATNQRLWTERMQQLYGTPLAKANYLRAAGLNAKLGDTSMSSIGSGATAQTPQAPQMQSYNSGADIANGFVNGASSFLSAYQADTNRLSQQSQAEVNDTIVNLNKMRADTEKLVQDLRKQDYRIGEQTLQQMEANTKYLQYTLNSRIRQQYTLESISEWQRQNVKYNALTQQYRLYNLEPAQVEQTLANITYSSAAAFNQFAQGELTYRQFLNYPKELAIRQTIAHASVMQGRAALMSGKAALMNAENYGRLLRSQTKHQDLINEQTQFYNDFWLGKVSSQDALKFIKRDVPIWSLYKTNLATSQQTFLNLTYQPQLIESLTRANNASAVRNEWGKYDDLVRTATDMIGTGFDVYTKGATHGLRKQQFNLDWQKAHGTKYRIKRGGSTAEYYDFDNGANADFDNSGY